MKIGDFIKELEKYDQSHELVFKVFPDIEDIPESYGGVGGFRFAFDTVSARSKRARQFDGKDTDILIVEFKARDY